MSQIESDDVEERFEALFKQIDELTDHCHYKSAVRVANEIRRLAKSEGRLGEYVRGLFRSDELLRRLHAGTRAGP